MLWYHLFEINASRYFNKDLRYMRKIVAVLLVLSFGFANTLPAIAAQKVEAGVAVEAETPKKLTRGEKKALKESKKIKQAKNKADYINMPWFEQFNDTNLNIYILKAVQNNKDVQMATIAVDEYYQSARAQLGGELPQVMAGFAPAYLDNIGEFNGWHFGLPVFVNYELDLFLKNRNKTQSAKKLYEASILDEKSAYISVASAVANVYFNIVKLDEVIDIQDEIVTLRKEIYEMMQLSNKEGIVSTSDLVKAHKSYVAGQSELTDLKKTRSTLLNQLAVLIGESADKAESFERTKYSDISFTGIIPDEIESIKITKRPDFMKAEKMVEKSGIDVRVARKEFLPSINIGGLALFNADNLGSLLTTNNILWGLTGGAMMNLFTGGKKVANLKIKKSEYERVLKNYEKTNLVAIQEINDSLVAIKNDRQKYEDNTKILKLELQDYRMAELKYENGVISKLDLNQVKENLLDVNKLIVANNCELWTDYLLLYKSVGTDL